MRTVTKPQIKTIRTLLSKLGQGEYKDGIVQELTKGRTTHISELTVQEAHSLIKNLNDPNEATAEKQRRYLLAMAHEMRWELPDGKVDMGRVNGWVANYGHLGKGKRAVSGLKLNDYKGRDLQKLIWQFEEAYKDYINGV